MIKLFTKIQQKYIAEKLKPTPHNNARWCELGEDYLLTLDGFALYRIPRALLWVKLEEKNLLPGLRKLIEDAERRAAEAPPAYLDGTTAAGQHIIRSDSAENELTVYARPEVIKPFLAVKGASFKVYAEKSPIVFYLDGKCLGFVMPAKHP